MCWIDQQFRAVLVTQVLPSSNGGSSSNDLSVPAVYRYVPAGFEGWKAWPVEGVNTPGMDTSMPLRNKTGLLDKCIYFPFKKVGEDVRDVPPLYISLSIMT